MIEKVVQKKSLQDLSEIKDNLAYWLSKTPQERVAEVERLRKQRHGSSARLQRTARVIQRSLSRKELILNKRALGRKKDLADLEALGEE
ncbi:MAG: hypothetical protein HZA23_04815 [Nitrospirae bacterium]|nr:hypothetical protein [Nitrospirota bacterium]